MLCDCGKKIYGQPYDQVQGKFNLISNTTKFKKFNKGYCFFIWRLFPILTILNSRVYPYSDFNVIVKGFGRICFKNRF